MIFNNYLTEQEIVKELIKTSELEDGFILNSYYNEETDTLLINEISYIKESAPDIAAKKVYLGDKNNKRYILIGGTDRVSHGGRMKISKKGHTSMPNNPTITLKINKNDEIDIIGSLNDINMSTKEFKKYKEFVRRNKNLINLAKTEDLQYINDAVIKDAKLYHDGIDYERTKEGNLIIYEKDKDGNRIIKNIEDLKGRKIKND